MSRAAPTDPEEGPRPDREAPHDDPPPPRPRLYVLLVAVSALSAVLGFAREATIGALFGASRSTDAFYAALSLPFLAAYFLVGGALAPSLTAALARRLERGDAEGARATFTASLRAVALGGSAIAALLYLAREPIARLLAPGFDGASSALLARLLALLLPYGLLTSLALLASAALLAAGAYRTPAVAVLAGNAVALGTLFALGARSIESAAWALDAGAAATLLALVPRLASAGLLPKYPGAKAPLPWRDSAILALSLAAAGAVDLAERPLASTAGIGAVAILAFASKLVHLPMRLVAAPLASVSFPRFARLLRRHEGRAKEAGETAAWIVRLLAFSAAVTAGAAAPIAAVTFGRGRFDADDLARLAQALALLAPAVVAVGVVEVATKYLLAARRARAVLVAQLAGLLVYLVAAPLLARHGIAGLAVARDLSWGVAALGLVIPLARREGPIRPVDILASAAAALLAAPAASYGARLLSLGTLPSLALSTLAAAAVFAAALGAAAALGRKRA